MYERCIFFCPNISYYSSLGPLSKEERANQWWLWRMMDVPTANQSQTPCHTWVGQEGWSPPSCTQLPSFQHLTLSSTSDQRPCYGHSQASVQGTLQVNNAQQTHTRPLHFIHSQHWAMSPPFLVSHTHTRCYRMQHIHRMKNKCKSSLGYLGQMRTRILRAHLSLWRPLMDLCKVLPHLPLLSISLQTGSHHTT